MSRPRAIRNPAGLADESGLGQRIDPDRAALQAAAPRHVPARRLLYVNADCCTCSTTDESPPSEDESPPRQEESPTRPDESPPRSEEPPPPPVDRAFGEIVMGG
jgi:hypothetical protein